MGGTSWGTASIELLKWQSRCIWAIARRPVCLKQGAGWEIINWTRKKWGVWGGVLLETESPSLVLGLWFLLWVKQKDIGWFERMGDMIWQVTGSCVLSWEHPKDQEWKHSDQLVRLLQQSMWETMMTSIILSNGISSEGGELFILLLKIRQ